ncbi:hypothetical protein pb186bvf_012417 [Paramecium bursaria]
MHSTIKADQKQFQYTLLLSIDQASLKNQKQSWLNQKIQFIIVFNHQNPRFKKGFYKELLLQSNNQIARNTQLDTFMIQKRDSETVLIQMKIQITHI